MTRITPKVDVFVIPLLILLLVCFLHEILDAYYISGELPMPEIGIYGVCLIVAIFLLIVWLRIRRIATKTYFGFVKIILFLFTFTAIHVTLTSFIKEATGVETVSFPPCYTDVQGTSLGCFDPSAHGKIAEKTADIMSLPLGWDFINGWINDNQQYLLCDWLDNNRTFLRSANSFIWALAALPFWLCILIIKLPKQHHSPPKLVTLQTPADAEYGTWPPPPSQVS